MAGARVSLDLEFADGKTRTIRPLTIRRLRKFMAVAEKIKVPEDGKLRDEDIDNMMEAAVIIMDGTDEAIPRDEIEDVLDVDIFCDISVSSVCHFYAFLLQTFYAAHTCQTIEPPDFFACLPCHLASCSMGPFDLHLHQPPI